MKGAPRTSRARKGWLSAAKRPGSRKKATPLWQWIVGIPILVLIGGGILAYVYIAYFHQK